MPPAFQIRGRVENNSSDMTSAVFKAAPQAYCVCNSQVLQVLQIPHRMKDRNIDVSRYNIGSSEERHGRYKWPYPPVLFTASACRRLCLGKHGSSPLLRSTGSHAFVVGIALCRRAGSNRKPLRAQLDVRKQWR
ncbi:unnamed protein product, partial [Hapterophycus canaliculatus]